MGTFLDDPVQTYERYITACNDRRFDDLTEFVAADVVGVRNGLDGWQHGLRQVVDAFPDFTWNIEELIVAGHLMAGRLTDTGTHRHPFDDIAASGQRIRIQELAIYRIDDHGKIIRCWGDLDTALRNELRCPAS